MFASGNLECPNVPGSCKNSMVGDILRGGKVLHPVAKNKMSLR